MKQLIALLLVLVAGSAQAREVLSHGRFDKITMYQPKGTPTSFVVFLSGDAGWNGNVINMAKALTQKGALVAGVDTPALLRNFQKDGGDCFSPVGDLENLSHFLQAYYKLGDYYRPILVGYDIGATLTYGTLGLAPDKLFGGAMALSFSPELAFKKPLCKGDGFKFEVEKNAQGKIKRSVFYPTQRIKAPFVVLQGDVDPKYPSSAVQIFMSTVSNGRVVMLPNVGRYYGHEKDWKPKFLENYQTIVTSNKATSPPPPPTSLGNLPVVEVPSQGKETDTFAILISGDGGWAGLDKEVAAALTAKGVRVVGVDSLRYFWAARTPASTAADTDRIIHYYASKWKKKRVILIGYSQGANVMPFIVTRLSKASLEYVSLAVGMGLSEFATFEFHLSNWVSNGKEGLPTLPEVARMRGIPFLCIYGAGEDDTICPKLQGTPSARVVKLPGGHHFDGNYKLLAEEILKAMPR
ncbi:MAG: AcvB/VirJ family lysyl-phosphatidylglycerol hydrolase [Pseudomonadota bacterium]